MRNAALALAAAMLVVAAASAFAQSDARTPVDITVKVTDVERVHGTLYDEWSFTVAVTNNHAHIVEVGIDAIYTDALNTATILPECPSPDANDRYLDTVLVSPGHTTTLSRCGITHIDAIPDLLEIAVWVDPSAYDTERSTHYVTTDKHLCNHIREFESSPACTNQSLSQLIRDIEPAPTQCEVPPAKPTQTENMPSLGSAVYHRYLNNIVLTFDTPVTLADNWRESIRVQTETETGGMVTVDGLDQYTKNLMPDGSQIVWLTLRYGDVMQPTSEITDIELRIAPGTVTYGDGNVLRTVLLPPVEVVP